MTYFARNLNVRQEIHLDGFVAVSATGLTAAPFHIKGETSRFIASYLGLRETDKQIADIAEDTCVGGRIAPGRTA